MYSQKNRIDALRRGLLLSATAAVVALAAGIAKADEPLNIGVLVFDYTIPYFTPMIAGEEQAGKDFKVKLDMQDGKTDLATQIAVVQQFIAQHKDALVITASDSKGIAPVVRAANQAGIPVIANNTVIVGADSITYVGSDNVTYGRYLGKAACKLLNGKGNVAVIMGILGSSPQFDRKTGLEAEIKENCPGLKVIQEVTANWDNAQALAAGQDILNRFGKGQIDAIIGQGPETIAPARWAKENGRSDVKFIVGDVPVAVAAAIKAGYVDAAVWQDPYVQGYRSVQHAANWVRGKKADVPQPKDYTGNEVITKDNIDSIKPY
jgi:ABC-type sugar transport system substrate-binding protein